MRENGFNNVGLTTIRCKELDNALCDVISGSSKWCQMCHIYFEKDSIVPSFVNINLVSYPSDNIAEATWKNAGYAIVKSIDSEYTLILARDRQEQKFSYLARVQILSTPDGTIVNAKMLKILTPK